MIVLSRAICPRTSPGFVVINHDFHDLMGLAILWKMQLIQAFCPYHRGKTASLWSCLAALPVLLIVPFYGLAANVTIDAGSIRSSVAETAFGVHTSVYGNQWANANLTNRLIQSGIDTLRYPGGGYADVFHWSICRAQWENGITGGGLSPWWGDPVGGYGYVASGTDFGDFVKLLDSIGGKAVITVNYGSALNFTNGQSAVPVNGGQPKEAAAWVAYANADPGLYGTTNDIVIGLDAQTNNWRTAGYWAKLRASTSGEYSSWATADGVFNSYHSFLAINRDAPVGIKYWEIGNECFGTGYYDSTAPGTNRGYALDYRVPYNGTTRYGNTNLSPARYGQEVRDFAATMKAVDPTIKIGAVLSTPPDDYSWDVYAGKHWNPEVLSQCASNIDFVIVHWYPWIGNNNDGSNALWAVRTKLPLMINGTTPGADTGANAGLRDWINQYRADGTNVEIVVTEFNINGSLALSNSGPARALFAADAYATWMDLGVVNIDYLEMQEPNFLGDSSALTRGGVYYSLQTLRKMGGPGDELVNAASDQTLLRAHAALQQNGKLGLLLINDSLTSNQTVNVTVTNALLASSGSRFQFGKTNFSTTSEFPTSTPSSNSVSGLSNSFTVTVPALTMVVLTIPIDTNAPPNTAPTLAAISNQTVNAGQTVAFTADADDSDAPPQTLTFSLLAGPPNATLNTNTGSFSWRPWVTDADSTNLITLKVADNGAPSMSATQNFTITVNSLAPPAIEAASSGNGLLTLTLSGDAGPDYAVLASTNLTDWDVVFVTNSPPLPFVWTETNAQSFPYRFYKAAIGPPLP